MTTIQMFKASSRRIKGAGREGRQYEPAMRIGVLHVEGSTAILPNGNQMFLDDGDILPLAMAAAERDGWSTDRDMEYISSCAQAARRDSEPVRQLRKLAMVSGHGGNGLHKRLGVSREALAMWRNGVVEMPAEVAGKIAEMLAE